MTFRGEVMRLPAEFFVVQGAFEEGVANELGANSEF